MAEAGAESPLAFSSHDTALCLIPPAKDWKAIENLRSTYDKAYEKWPPHINLVYPFVTPNKLPQAASHLASCIKPGGAPIRVCLDSSGSFVHRQHSTIFVRDADTQRVSRLSELRNFILEAFNHSELDEYRPHLTVAQSTNEPESQTRDLLVQKASYLPTLSWDVVHLAILTRDRTGEGSAQMRVWGLIDLTLSSLIPRDLALEICPDRQVFPPSAAQLPTTNSPLSFYSLEKKWRKLDIFRSDPPPSIETNGRLIIASYNVLAEFQCPPDRSRYPFLIEVMLGDSAIADVLLLQEVTDDFLGVLLADDRIRQRYPFVTHGPPDQEDLEPLTNFLNIVILSRLPFTWTLLNLGRLHKPALIAKFNLPDAPSALSEDEPSSPLIVVAVHLTHGLTDGAVVAKKNDLRGILDYLSSLHSSSPWILAGDTNITTSSFTIREARKKKSISLQSLEYLRSLDTMLSDASIIDAWSTARLEMGESSDDHRNPKNMLDSYEGEQGATYDPTENSVALAMTGAGSNNRPQRYDRILAKTEDLLHVAGFNLFGFPDASSIDNSEPRYASDHWGVRCLFRIGHASSDTMTGNQPEQDPVNLVKAPDNLRDVAGLKDLLIKNKLAPSDADELLRSQALELIKNAVVQACQPGVQTGTSRVQFPLVVVPVGSYGLGVWTRDSDIDCMVIGPFSPKVFFTILTARLRVTDEIKIVRRVKSNVGTMFVLDVLGVKMDLQYCASTAIAEKWPDVMRRPSSDPIFALPTQTLLKLKPLRDLWYLRRSIPDMAQFRTCYMVIKAWAKSRGIYSSVFGYLAGIHITTMLVRLCKIIFHDRGAVSVPDILATFFDHYSTFDWKTSMVFDPFFHKRLRYTRTFREPICLLGWHPPMLNTALAASLPTVKVISWEFKTANRTITNQRAGWHDLVGLSLESSLSSPIYKGDEMFLQQYKSYVKIDMQHWGPSQEKTNSFVGWLQSRTVILLVDIDRKIPELNPRVWPDKFVEINSVTPLEGKEQYQGCLLVGLEWANNGDESNPKEDNKSVQGALQSVLTRFEDQIRGDAKYYDPLVSWMSATVVSRKQLGKLTRDPRDWVEFADSDDEMEFDEDEDDLEGEEEENIMEGLKSLNFRHKKYESASSQVREGGKLRSAMDVLNRLRWDEKMDSSDYLVGYEDRFLGAQEKLLELWKSDATDDEFIPQHRILYFRRKSDGIKVWERRTRTDLVFKSQPE